MSKALKMLVQLNIKIEMLSIYFETHDQFDVFFILTFLELFLQVSNDDLLFLKKNESLLESITQKKKKKSVWDSQAPGRNLRAWIK